MEDLNDIIARSFESFQSKIELQPHQEYFCSAEQDLVFFGGK